MSFYLVFKFSNDLKDLKKERKRRSAGHPSTPKTDTNIKKIGKIVRKNRCLSIRAVAELINIDKETVRQILYNNFNMKKVFENDAETSPRFLI